MSTVYAIDDVAALSGAPASGDKLFIHDVSTGRTRFATVAQVLGGETGVVATTATQLTVTAASHAGKVVVVSSTAPIAVTLPQATGTGNKYRFALQVSATGTSHTISVANATDVISGVAHVMTSATLTNVAAVVAAFKTSDSSDRVTLNGTTLGGIKGDWIEFVDVATGLFQVSADLQATGAYATPFSAAV
jgi:hypothetical protein